MGLRPSAILRNVGEPGGRWRVDPGDGVHPINLQYANSATITDERMTRRDYLKPEIARAVLSPISLRREGEEAFVVLAATPLKSQTVELWFDCATFLLDRSIRVLPLYVETMSYSDYQAVDGLMLPFVVATGSGDPGDVDTVKISNYRIDASLPADSFAEPSDHQGLDSCYPIDDRPHRVRWKHNRGSHAQLEGDHTSDTSGGCSHCFSSLVFGGSLSIDSCCGLQRIFSAMS